MKNVAFHSNQLSVRGTEVALYDYAFYNETILGNKSYIISNANSDLTSLNKFKNKFEVFLYNRFEDCFEFCKNKNITHCYFIKAGDNDGKIIPGIKNAIHVVFQNKQIHGDSYSYVSDWLASTMGMPNNYVPHIVSLPSPKTDYRLKLNIPKDHIVIGRYGGYTEFDIPFVYNEIYNALQKRSDLTFLFMETKPFGPPHPRIIFVNSTFDSQNKSNFISTCDYMIHARNHGESFGLAICEFLFCGKPIISWKGGLDQHHFNLLKESEFWYQTPEQLREIFFNLKKPVETLQKNCKSIVEQFSPSAVMFKFEKMFLN